MTATDIVKTVDVLTAIRWIKLSWDVVTSKMIVNCFRHCGMKEIKEVECDPFADLDGTDEDDTHKDPSAEDLVEHSVNIDELVSQFDSSMTTAEYIEADDDPTTSFTFNDLDNWREELRAMVCETPAAKRVSTAETSESEKEDENEEPEPVPSSIASIEDAVAVASYLLSYVSENGLEDTAEHLTYVVASLQHAQIKKKSTQSSILQYSH